MGKEERLVVVFRGNPVEAHLAKNALHAGGVEAMLTDELMGTIAPFQTSPGGVGATKVLVNKSDAERAREILGTDFGEEPNDEG
jgi:hypothetical protein